MVFDPTWASDENALIDVPSDAEIRTGFVCGPASPGRFNWLFQTIMSAVNALNIGDMASKFRTIATTEGIAGGGNLEADRTLRLDFAGLQPETSIANDDLIAIYDTSVGAHRHMTRANFVAGLGGEGGSLITTAENIGGGVGLFSAVDGEALQFRTLVDAGGFDIVIAGDVVALSLSDMNAALTFD